jgi:PAS domain S-box-containing protein
MMIKILHVDDERAEHILLKFNLHKINKDIAMEWVPSGREALEEINRQAFDCIICDYQMPGMNGLQLHENLAQNSCLIPFIFRTGQGSEKLAAEALRAGVSDYFTKGEGFAHYERFYNSIVKHIEAYKQKLISQEALEKIKHNEKLLYQTQRIAKLGAYTYNIRSDRRESSQAEQNIFGFKQAADLSFQDWMEMIHPDDRERMKEYFFNDVLGNKKNFENEYRILNPESGQTRWVYDKAELLLDEAGNPEKLLGTIQDITRDKKITSELKESQETLENIFNSSTPICIVNSNFELLKANDAYIKTFNVKHDNPDKKCYEIRPNSLCRTENCPITKILNGAPEASEELERENDAGEQRWYIATAKPVKNSYGEITGIVENYQDITALKRTQFALENSEQRFRDFFEKAPLSYQSLDKNGLFVDVNKTFLDTLGYDKDEIIGHSYAEILTDSCKDVFIRNFPILKSCGEVHNLPFEVVKKDGTTLRIELEGRVSYDDKVNFRQTHCIFQDVTEKINTQRELLQKSQELETIFQTANPICITDLDCNVIKANMAYEEIFGNLEEKKSCKCYDIRKGETCFTDACPINAIKAGTPLVQHEVTKVDSQGNTRVFLTSARPFLDEQAKLLGIIESFQDITDIRISEQALLRSEERFRELFENIHSGVAIYRPVDNGQDFEIVNINSTAERLDDFNREEILGKKVTEAFPGVEEFGLLEVMRKVARSGKPVSHPMSLYQDDKLRRWRENYVYKLPTGEIVAIFRDLTDLKEQEQKLEKQRYYLEKVQDIGKMGAWEIDFNSMKISFTNEIYNILEFPQDSEHSFDQLKENIYKPDLKKLLIKWDEIYRGKGFDLEHRLEINGKIIWVRQKAEPVLNKRGKAISAIGFIQDISYRKRQELLQEALLRLIDFSPQASIEELLTKFLDEAELLTYSEIGFLHFYDQENQDILLQTWSTNTMKNMCDAREFDSHYPIEKAGVWVDAVREKKPVVHNDFASLDHKKGLPDGHASVIRELVVPVIRDGIVVAILGVGNKSSDYNNDDITTIQKLADYAWEIVERRRAESNLAQSNQNLAEAQRITAMGSWEYDVVKEKLHWSDEMFNLFEIESLPANLDAVLERIHPDDRGVFKEAIEKKDSTSFQYRLIRPNGKIKHVQAIRHAVHNKAGGADQN